MRIMKSDELKEAMKESPKRYTNPFLLDEENEKVNFWNDQELEHSNIKDGLINNCEDDKFRNSLAPCNVPSEFCEKETELYTDKNVMECEFPELLVCYKEGAFHVKDICIDEGIPNGESVFDENNNEILKHERLIFSPAEDYYVESNLCSGTNGKIDTDLPILEPTYDCVNFGDIQDKLIEKKSDVSSETKVDADLTAAGTVSDHHNTDTAIQNQDLQNSVPDKDYEDADLTAAGPIKDCGNAKNISTDTDIQNHDLQNLIPGKDYEDAAANECGISEEFSDSVVPTELKNVSKDDGDNEDGTCECAPEKLNFLPESDAPLKATESHGPDVKSSGDLLDNASTEQVVSNCVSSLQQERPLPSLKSLLEAIRQQSRQSPVEEICKSTNISNDITMADGNKSLNLVDGKPGTSSSFHKVENLECVDGHSRESHGVPKPHDLDSDNVTMVNVVHRGEGESSFSVAGPVSGLITYSGPIAYSGSISHRSDSSTTSTRSFAFPILQNEWNSSPVRMAKADRRRLQKSRGWRHGLLCCRF